jgi:O-antigen/teichoic acid export membrane protein
MRSELLRQAAVYFVGDLLVRAGSLLLVPIYTRTLTRAEYGQVAVATLVTTVISYLASFSMGAAVLKLGPELATTHRQDCVTHSIVKWVAVWSLVLAGLLMAVTPLLSELIFQSAALAATNRLAVLTGCFAGITTVALAVFQGNQQPMQYRVVTICAFVANLGTGLIAVLGFRLGAWGAILGQCVGAGVGCVIALCSLRISLRAPFAPGVIGRALAIGCPLTIYSLGGFSADQLSRVFVERYVSASALGVYNIALLYCTAVAFVFGALNTAWVPRFFQLAPAAGTRQSSEYGTAVIAGAIAMGGIMTLLAPLVIGWLVGKDYQEAVVFVPPLMLNAVLAGPVWSLLVNPLMLTGRNWRIAACAVISGACNLVLNVVLTRQYGMWGAAFSSMIALVLLTGLIGWFSFRAYPVIYEYRAILAVGLAVIASCLLAVMAAPAGIVGHLVRLALALACGGFTWAVLHRQWRKRFLPVMAKPI